MRISFTAEILDMQERIKYLIECKLIEKHDILFLRDDLQQAIDNIDWDKYYKESLIHEE